jgi:hypothetical protein
VRCEQNAGNTELHGAEHRGIIQRKLYNKLMHQRQKEIDFEKSYRNEHERHRAAEDKVK